MPLLPPNFLDCVVAIGTGRDAAKRRWVGTGFFYGFPSGQDAAGAALYTIFLVSNKHVFENLKEIWIKVNAEDGASCKDYRAELVARNGRKLWISHSDPDIDVAALWLNAQFLKREKRQLSFFLSESQVLTAAELAGTSISEGDGVFLLGFPMEMVDRVRPYAICRTGGIARIADVKNVHGKEILIDGLVFPGNNGGPVVTKPELASVGGMQPYRSSSLLGIVSSYVPYQETARSDQTGRPRMIFEENSGLTSVVPAELIHQTVLLAQKRVRNRFAQKRFQAKKAQVAEQAVQPDNAPR